MTTHKSDFRRGMKRGAARSVGVALLAFTLLFGNGVTAHAVTKYPSAGGTWQYGLYEPSSDYIVYSYYSHPKAKHRSTACNLDKCQRSAIVRAGGLAMAEVRATGKKFGVENTAFYYRY